MIADLAVHQGDKGKLTVRGTSDADRRNSSASLINRPPHWHPPSPHSPLVVQALLDYAVRKEPGAL